MCWVFHFPNRQHFNLYLETAPSQLICLQFGWPFFHDKIYARTTFANSANLFLNYSVHDSYCSSSILQSKYSPIDVINSINHELFSYVSYFKCQSTSTAISAHQRSSCFYGTWRWRRPESIAIVSRNYKISYNGPLKWPPKLCDLHYFLSVYANKRGNGRLGSQHTPCHWRYTSSAVPKCNENFLFPIEWHSSQSRCQYDRNCIQTLNCIQLAF